MSIDSQRWLQLSPWLDQVLDLPPDRRDAWLDDLAGRDAALAAELRALLAGGSAGAGAQLLQDLSPSVALQSMAGRRIGAYTLVEPLGEGGMGTVWLAERSDGRFEGRAAVKLLHAGIVQRALAARFRREGAILARLSHPHIARLVDAGLTEDGQPYLVLEHVAGERIDQWCDTRRLGLRARVELFGQVLQAVQHAHGQLVVHRDLKPGNVLVDTEGKVKLLDFGIAKLLDDEAAPGEATELTREGGRVLTPQYAAPEQARGDTVTTATDVYALGLLLYLLLTGQHPRLDAQGRHDAQAGELPLASRVVVDRGRRSDAELQAAAASRNAVPARLAHALAGDLDNILAKALRAEPPERYATADAFADDLRRHLEGQTVSARPDSWAYRASRFVGRHKAGVVLATVALGAIVTAATVAEQQRRAAERERRVAEQQRDTANRQRAAAEAVTIFMQEQLGQIGAPGRALDLAARIDLGQRRADQLFFDVPEVHATLNGIFFALNSDLGRDDTDDRLRNAVVDAAQRIDDPISRADALCVTEPNGMSDAEAVDWLDRALDGLPAGEASGGVRWRCLAHRAVHLRALGRYDEALRDLEAGYEAAPPLMKRLRAISYLRQKAHLLNEVGRPHGAEVAMQQVVGMMQGAGREQSLQTSDDRIFQAIFTWRMGRPRDAVRLAEQAAETARPEGRNAGIASFITLIHARILLDLEQWEEARRLWEGVMLRDGRLVVPFRRAWDFAAPLSRLRGDPAAGVAGLEQDLAQHQGRLPQRDAINRTALVDELLAQREASRALAVLDTSADVATFRWERHWQRARAHNLAGQAVPAEAAARAAIAEAVHRAPPDGRSALHGHAHLELARALAAQARSSEARAAAERAAAELHDTLGPEHGATRAATALARH